jgi:hypothetical protein
MDVRLTGVDGIGLLGIDVEPEDLYVAASKLDAKREANVAKSDDGEHEGSWKFEI